MEAILLAKKFEQTLQAIIPPEKNPELMLPSLLCFGLLSSIVMIVFGIEKYIQEKCSIKNNQG